jgi:hypothetical protein
MVKPGRRLGPETVRARIPVPVVHVISKRDVYAGEGRLLMELCEASQCIKAEHPDGASLAAPCT